MPEKNLGPDQPKGDEGWKEVTCKKEKKGNLSKAAVSTSPSKEKTFSQDKHQDPTPVTLESTPAAPEPAPEKTTEPKSPSKSAASSVAPPSKVSKKKKMKPAAEPEETPMETIVNLKRRSDTGEGSSKKICRNTSPQQHPLEGTSNQLRAGIRLVELQHPSLNKMFVNCGGRTPIYVHPSFKRALKVRFPLDVGGLSGNAWVATELSTSSLRQTISNLIPEDFQPVVDTE